MSSHILEAKECFWGDGKGTIIITIKLCSWNKVRFTWKNSSREYLLSFGISPRVIAQLLWVQKVGSKFMVLHILIIFSCCWFAPLLKESSLQAKSVTNIQLSSICFCVYQGLPQKLFTSTTSTITFMLLSILLSILEHFSYHLDTWTLWCNYKIQTFSTLLYFSFPKDLSIACWLLILRNWVIAHLFFSSYSWLLKS